MNERALTVFEQYELDITETFKIRGNYGCNTNDSSNYISEDDEYERNGVCRKGM